jgi:F-type H+-transporting ATPase subunit alpha
MESFAQFASDLDASTKQLLNRGARLTELLKQPQFSPFAPEEEVVSLFAGTRGYLDKLKLADVTRFEKELLTSLRSGGSEILAAIRDTKKLDKDVEEKLIAFLDQFTARFA